MADFATPTLSRDQLVLFPERLDQAIAADHAVRLLDDILARKDWTPWERAYDLTRGQPPIHPRVLAGAVLYGLLKRIRTSRSLEEAIEVRNDFRWLVEGRSIDHTTICKFRQKNSDRLGDDSQYKLSEELADVALRQQRVDAALAELERLELAGEKVPARIPITDPQSRVTPNKEGGFAPNYTPTATVDIDSGLIVEAGVIAHTDEDKHMLASVENVQEAFGLEDPPGELLADGMMSSGENLAACDEKGIDLYSPIKLGGGEDNLALRDDPSEQGKKNTHIVMIPVRLLPPAEPRPIRLKLRLERAGERGKPIQNQPQIN